MPPPEWRAGQQATTKGGRRCCRVTRCSTANTCAMRGRRDTEKESHTCQGNVRSEQQETVLQYMQRCGWQLNPCPLRGGLGSARQPQGKLRDMHTKLSALFPWKLLHNNSCAGRRKREREREMPVLCIPCDTHTRTCTHIRAQALHKRGWMRQQSVACNMQATQRSSATIPPVCSRRCRAAGTIGTIARQELHQLQLMELQSWVALEPLCSASRNSGAARVEASRHQQQIGKTAAAGAACGQQQQESCGTKQPPVGCC